MLEIRLNETETDEQSRSAYEDVYSDVGLSQPMSFYLWLLDLLQLQPGESYLDISCGRAELVGAAQSTAASIYGLDLSHNALLVGGQRTGNQKLVTANSQQLPYADASFDVISSIGSLEHYTDMALAVREKSRVLKPNGRALILVPNTFSLFNNIWVAWRQGRTAVDPYQPIQRYGARYEWQDLLEDNGLVVEKTIKYETPWPRTSADRRHYFARPRELVRLLCTPFIPLNLAFCFVYFCRRAS